MIKLKKIQLDFFMIKQMQWLNIKFRTLNELSTKLIILFNKLTIDVL